MYAMFQGAFLLQLKETSPPRQHRLLHRDVSSYFSFNEINCTHDRGQDSLIQTGLGSVNKMFIYMANKNKLIPFM